jgi:pSer/pThr/pTyr-binding forkhead associated (FHA) protein
VKLSEFLERFGSLDDGAFQAGFNHPFLLQEGKLSVEGGGAERHVYLLRPPPGGKLVVGRTSTIEVSIPDKQVSSKHAELFERDGHWHVTDTGSTNGTFVDGKRLTPGQAQGLSDAIPIRFGPDAAFMFLTAASFLPIFRRLQEKAGKEEEIRPGVLDAQTEAKGISVRKVQEAASRAARPEARGPDLFLCCDGMDGVRLEIGKPVILGRSPGHATMVLPHGEVSRAHAEILRTTDRQVTVRDLGSANGTFLCGQRLGASAVELPIGKALTLGPFTLHLQGPPSDAGLTVQVDPRQLKGVSGDLEKTGLSDVFQEIEAEQKTGVIEVFGDGMTGRVSFRAGQPCNAKTNDNKAGEEAIKALLTLKKGTFNLKSDASAVGPQRIERAFSDILLEEFLGS